MNTDLCANSPQQLLGATPALSLSSRGIMHACTHMHAHPNSSPFLQTRVRKWTFLACLTRPAWDRAPGRRDPWCLKH